MKRVRVLVVLYFMSTTLGVLGQAKNNVAVYEKRIIRTYQWVYDSISFKIGLSLSKNDFLYYRRQSKHILSEQSYVRFATEEAGHRYYSDVLKQLDSIAGIYHFNKSEFAGFLIAFVQQGISYKKDPYNWGADYPRYGIETLVDGHGDCEDMACLLLGLMRSMNYDVVLVAIPGHMALAVSCEDCGGRYFDFHGRRYFYLESTGPGNPLGYEADEMTDRRHNLYNIPRTAFYPLSIPNIVVPLAENLDTLCLPTENRSTDDARLETYVKSARPASKYNQSNIGNVSAPKSQPKTIIRLSEMHSGDW